MIEPEQLAYLHGVLDAAGVEYAFITHSAHLASADDGVQYGLGTLGEMAPTLLLKTGPDFRLAILGGDRRLSYKKIKKHLHLRDVALASPEQVRRLTGAEPGSVSLVNPGLPTLVDAALPPHAHVYGGTGLPGHTLRITVSDLIAVTGAEVFDFSEEK